MVSSCITSEQIMSAVRQVPVERWGELLRVIEGLQAPEQSSATTKSPVRTGTDLKGSELIGIWADRSDIGDSHEFAQKLRRLSEQRDR